MKSYSFATRPDASCNSICWRLLAFLAFLALLTGCGHEPTHSVVPGAGEIVTLPGESSDGWRVEMINKREDPTIGPMTFYQWNVRIVHPEKGSRVLRWPVYGEPTVADNRVFLFPGKNQENKKLVIQQLDSRRHTVMNLPRDCDPYFGSPGVSPCGRMLAYYALSQDYAQARIRVVRIERNWPLIAESAWHETVGTDVAPTPPRWDDGKKVVGDPLFFYFQNDHQDNQVIVPLIGSIPHFSHFSHYLRKSLAVMRKRDEPRYDLFCRFGVYNERRNVSAVPMESPYKAHSLNPWSPHGRGRTRFAPPWV